MTAGEVTVVVPTRNRIEVLPTTLHAILCQTVPVQVVVVDESSSDGTAEWLAALDDERVRILRHDEPRMLPGARNAGLAVTTTPWVAFCDDDDLWAPTKLERQLEALRATGARWAATGAVLVDPDLGVIGHHDVVGGDVLRPLLANNVVPAGGSSVMVDAELLRSVGGFDETMRSSEDWEAWIRVAQRSPMASASGPLTAYRIWRGSMSTDVDRMRSSRDVIVDRYRDLAARLDVHPNDVHHERYIAKQLVRAGNGAAAARVYARLGLRHRQPAQLVRAAVALVAPATVDRVGTRRAVADVPADWRASADVWLAPLRDHQTMGGRGGVPCPT